MEEIIRQIRITDLTEEELKEIEKEIKEKREFNF